MDALDIPRLRGVTHAYAFWLALVAAAGLVLWAPGGAARAAAVVYGVGGGGPFGGAGLVLWTPGGAARTAAMIYGIGLCALFGGSALYHRWRWHPRWRPILRRVDHSTIYLFIAASYTPVGMLVLSGSVRWIVMIIVW